MTGTGGQPTNPKQPSSQSGSQPGLMRSLGRFFGHIGHAVKTPAPSGERAEVSRETQEAEAVDDQGRKVILRRTTIDEVEVRED